MWLVPNGGQNAYRFLRAGAFFLATFFFAVFLATFLAVFLTTFFFVAEIFTGTPGKYVSLEDTIKAFKGILNGDYDHLPEQAFYMVGTIEEAVEKAKTL